VKVVIFFIFLTKIFSSQNYYENFISYIHENNKIKLEINLIQIQYDEYFETDGIFYYYNQNYYVYDMLGQRIIYNDNEIKTINKLDKQIIYENSILNEFTIFDLISGKNDHINILESIILQDKIKMLFKIEDWLIKGSITTNILSGAPKEIELISDKDVKTIIKVLSQERIKNIDLETIDTDSFQIIDLRE